MAAKKRPVKQQLLLSAVARTLGHAAGTFTKVTQELKENFSALPETVITKVREAANSATPAKRSRGRTQHPKKKIRRAAQTRRAKGVDTAEKRRLPKNKSPRSSRKSPDMKK